MEFIDEELNQYCLNHTSAEPAILSAIDRDTHANVLMPRMLSGHLQGRVLAMLSHMIRPSRVLEIGTYTGYSALCFAEGLADGGKVITLDKNEELESRVRAFFEQSEFGHKIDYLIGNAVELIPTLQDRWDLVFIDADKKNYSVYLDLIEDQVNIGGFVVADNVLWSGKVVANGKIDKDTQALLDFNQKVQDSSVWENVLMPLRDGLMVMRKVK